MARIRTVKPEFCESESIGKLSRDARLLFIQLWTFVDDSGKSRASSRLLASRLYPYDTDAPQLIDRWLEELERGGHIRLYEVEGCQYLDIPKWLKHQRIDHPGKSRLPEFREGLAKPREDKRDIRDSYLGPRTVGPRTLDLGEEYTPNGVVACATAAEIAQAFALFNDAAKRTGWPAAQKIDDGRKKKMLGRLKDAGGIDGFAVAVGKAEASEFLTVTWPNFNIDWLLKPANFTKLMEGNYDRKQSDANRTGIAADAARAADLLRGKQYHGL